MVNIISCSLAHLKIKSWSKGFANLASTIVVLMPFGSRSFAAVLHSSNLAPKFKIQTVDPS